MTDFAEEVKSCKTVEGADQKIMAGLTIHHDQAAIDRHNEQWRFRLHRQLDALCDDAEGRNGFFGFVNIQINWMGSRIHTVDTNIKQTIK